MTPAQRDATATLLRERLSALQPVSLVLVDESEQHAGHAGAREGGHFRLEIVAEAFRGLGRLQAQRLVLDHAGDLRSAGIHALSITARAPKAV